jgi:iron complex outermembrane receptor protein
MNRRLVSLAKDATSSLSAVALLLITAALPTIAWAQAAPAPAEPISTAASDSSNAPILLNPFEVSTDRDVGYLANSTLSGTQFNTELKDTAASIEVFTPDFIQDLGAFNVKDVMAYGNNTVQDLDEGTAGGTNGNALTYNYSAFRVRGGDITQAVDYFVNANLPIDMYNIDRIEESRGPNSVLFGIGSPSGVVNYSTKQAVLGKSFGDFTLTTGSWGTLRGTLDFNQSFDDNKVAVRVDLADYNDGAYQLFADSHGRQGSMAVTYRITPKIELRARVEVGSVQDEGPRSFVYDNGVTEWQEEGRPLFQPNSAAGANFDPNNWGYAGNTGKLPGSGGANYAFNYIQINGAGSQNGHILNDAGQLFTSSYDNLAIINQSVVNPTVNMLGPHGQRDLRYFTDQVNLNMELAPRIFLQASFNHLQDHFNDWNNWNSGAALNVDPNAMIWDGKENTYIPNPNAGREYVETNANLYQDSYIFDRGRVQLSAEEDFGIWGHYHFAASAEEDNDSQLNFDDNEVWAGHPFNPTPDNSNNNVYRVSYVTEGVWNTYYGNSPGNNNALIQNAVDPNTGTSYSSVMVPVGITSQRSGQRDLMGIVQAQYFHDLLSVDYGWRRDTLNVQTRQNDRNAATDVMQVDSALPDNDYSIGGNTRSVGAVFHAIKTKSFAFDLLADESDNFGLPSPGTYELTDKTTGQTVQPMPGSTGTGSEWGVAFTFLDGMIYLKAVHFVDTTINLFNYTGYQDVGPTNDTILDALLAAGYISQSTHDSRSTSAADVYPFNQRDDGNEISLTANITKNWRLQVNFSENNPDATGVEAGDIAFFQNTLEPYYAQFPETVITADNNHTIAQELALANQNLAYNTSVEGKGVIGFRKYKWNFFTRYTLTSTPLKGLYVGGGYIFQSQMLIGAYPDGSNLYGGKTGTASGLLGYNAKVWKHPLRIQLNVLNLLNNRGMIVYRRATDTNAYYGGVTDYLLPAAIQYPDPISWRLSAEFPF